jgi:hypothetical protein
MRGVSREIEQPTVWKLIGSIEHYALVDPSAPR